MKTTLNGKILNNKEFIDTLVDLEILVEDIETATEFGYDLVFVENHVNYELYINHNAFNDTYAEDLNKISRIFNDGYDWFIQFYNESIDEYVIIELDIESIVIKQTVKSLDDLVLSVVEDTCKH